jgi:hypothetical protein
MIKMKFGSWLAAAIIAPFVVMSAELCLANYFNSNNPSWDYVGLALSVITGLCCLWQLPASKLKRTLMTIIFVPVCTTLLFFYTFAFVCAVFGDCL